MKYQAIIENEKFILQRTKTSSLRLTFFMVAVIGAGVALGDLFIFNNGFWLVVGGICSFYGFYLTIFIGIISRKHPETYIFDNENGVLEILHSKSELKKILIPYIDIKRLEIEWKSIPGKSAFDKHYFIVIKFTDDSCWEIMPAVDENTALNKCAEFNAQINWGKSTQIHDFQSKTISKSLQIEENDGFLKVSWKNKTKAYGIKTINFYLVIMVLISGITTFFSLGTDESFVDIIPIPGTAVGVLFILLVYECVKFLLYISKKHELMISDHHIQIPSLKLNLESSEIKQINFNYFQKREEREINFELKSYNKQSSKGFLKDMFDFEADINIKTLNMDGFSPIDVYFVKNLIQKTLYSI